MRSTPTSFFFSFTQNQIIYEWYWNNFESLWNSWVSNCDEVSIEEKVLEFFKEIALFILKSVNHFKLRRIFPNPGCFYILFVKLKMKFDSEIFRAKNQAKKEKAALTVIL